MNEANSSALYKIVFDKIATSPRSHITFAEYQDLVLYHPQYGYYSSGVVGIGATGDFFTASSLSADFGELLAIQFVEMWHQLGCPVRFTLLEMGAGNGNLAGDILRYLIANYREILPNLEYIIVEHSPALIKQQQQVLSQFNNINVNINLTWKNWSDLPDNSLVGCCFSNELVDAFPVHQIVIRDRQIQEIYLTVESESFKEVPGEISTSKLQDYFDLVEIDLVNNNYQSGYRTEVNLCALDWLDTVNSKLQQGYLLTIDYGYSASKYYHPQRSQGTLKCYYRHHHHNNPYVNLGEQDITTHVDFTALANYGKLQGLETIGLTKLAIFLMALGLGDRLEQLSNGQYNALQILQKRDALHQLINPLGLGGFDVLIQGKKLNLDRQFLKGLTTPN
jgi:SAM-dependent MidA family methyltransferase